MIRCSLVVDGMPFPVLVGLVQNHHDPILLLFKGRFGNVRRQFQKGQAQDGWFRCVTAFGSVFQIFECGRRIIAHLKTKTVRRMVQRNVLVGTLFADAFHGNVQFDRGTFVRKGVRGNVGLEIERTVGFGRGLQMQMIHGMGVGVVTIGTVGRGCCCFGQEFGRLESKARFPTRCFLQLLRGRSWFLLKL